MSDITNLLEEFPELSENDVLLEKEVLAHFGLLFAKFALLEASVQNIHIFSTLEDRLASDAISTFDNWEALFDEVEAVAFSSTLGTLLRRVECRFDNSMFGRLQNAKKARDYFAHHFFRDENGKFFNPQHCLALMARMSVLRRTIESMTSDLDEMTMTILSRIDPRTDLSQRLLDLVEQARRDATQSGGHLEFGWEQA